MTVKSQKLLTWAVPILATLTALVAVEELMSVKGATELIGLLLAIATAIFGYIAAVAKPDEPQPTPQPTAVKTPGKS